MYHIAICDDLAEERELLKAMLQELAAMQKLQLSITEYISGEALIAGCTQKNAAAELIFLDIYMDGINGMDAARKLRDAGIDIPIVFLTSAPDFAVASYDVAALFYLMKPVSAVKLREVFHRFTENYRPKSVLLQERLFIERDIVLAESYNKTVQLHFKDGTVAEIQVKLDMVEAALHGHNFLRCHQSFIVNMDYICGVCGYEFQTTIGVSALIRKREFTQIRKKYYNYLITL